MNKHEVNGALGDATSGVPGAKAGPAHARLIPTASQTVGPFFPPHFFGEGDHDLTFVDTPDKRASGQVILLTGRVYEADNVPRWNTIMGIWQADAAGRFAHPCDPDSRQADPNFMGWGRRWTDEEGYYSFITVKPGSYFDPLTGRRRAPHINLCITGSGLMRRLVTTLFIPDQPADSSGSPDARGECNASDPVFEAVSDVDARRRLILEPIAHPLAPAGALAYRRDIVLQGEFQTPFFLD